MIEEATPMIKQYMQIKANFKDSILFFRVGDFYETFYDDAKIISEILQIVLTQRTNGIPMAGIPYHSVDNYLKKLIDAGLKVAICDQTEDASAAKGIVRREVTRVLTPGTVIDEDMLDDMNRYSVLVYKSKNNTIICVFDFSTGEVYLDSVDFSEMELLDYLISTGFVQILLDEKYRDLYKKIKEISGNLYVEILDEWHFSEYFEEHLKNSYGIFSFEHLDFEREELKALDGVLKYLEATQFSSMKHFKLPKHFKNSDNMYIDSNTLANLGILNYNGSRGRTLFDVLNLTKTPMGKRKLSEYLQKPLLKLEDINKRLDITECFKNDFLLLEELKDYLVNIRDLDRISSRISLLKATPKDLIALKFSLNMVPYIKDTLGSNETLRRFYSELNELPELKYLLDNTIEDDPDQDVGSGKVIKSGISQELDEYRDISRDVDSILKSIEEKEKAKTGLSSLKIGRNKIYGFYIEISKMQAKSAPLEYIRKQTLTNCERFITEELQQLEQKIIVAEDSIKKLETSIYNEFMKKLSGFLNEIKKLAETIAEIDVLRSFGESANKNNYVRPVFDTEIKNSEIIKGRHPVVEKFVETYTDNDFILDEDSNFVVLTGPNMSGKSTYLRQIGLISIMGQCGSFVPAESAKLPVYDRVFTRIGARDDVVTGKSTFLVEMLEMSTILNKATSDSLILLDEVGRGTSTLDGISVAWAISEYIFEAVNAVTIFATHYTELTLLSEMYDSVVAKRVKVLETNDGVIFLHKIEEGTSDNSYGIEVARLAGFPAEVIDRAKEVLVNLSDKADIENRLKKVKNIKKKVYKEQTSQLKMF